MGVGEARLERFQRRIKGRLKDWREDEHRADGQLLKELKESPKRYRSKVLGTEPRNECIDLYDNS